MTETVITVHGRFSAFYPPERATLVLGVHREGPDRETVFAVTTESADTVRGRIAGAFDKKTGPITRFSSDTVQVWTEKPWSQDGAQLDPVFHAAIGFRATFSDFIHLARFVEEIASVAGVTVAQLDWDLTEASRSAVIAEVRSRAVKDAVAKASVYAQSIGLGTVRAIAIADEGMLNDGGPTTGQSRGVEAMRVSGTGAQPALALTPEDIEIEAIVDARFIAS